MSPTKSRGNHPPKSSANGQSEATSAPLVSDRSILDQALREREERARNEKMSVRSLDTSTPWADYKVSSTTKGSVYRVALRGMEPGISYCSCPDFRKNTLGTCKHIIRVQTHVKKRFKASERDRPYERQGFSVVIHYGESPTLHLLPPCSMSELQLRTAGPFLNRPVHNVSDFVFLIRRLEVEGSQVTVYPDAEELIQTQLVQARVRNLAEEIRFNPTAHPLRQRLLGTELLPHELDGIAFAAAAGRAILADDMGLSKTIQGIGTAELLAQESNINKVLVICPASSKSQWHNEIGRFSHRDCTLVSGSAKERNRLYADPSFFTVCNYEQVLRDISAIEKISWDMIILDEGQRIKNWEAKTSRIVKGLRSRFALVVTRSLLENRLEDLFSIVEFVDDKRLGPAFRFFSRHQEISPKESVRGYEDLDELQEKLAPILLHRSRASVLTALPESDATASLRTISGQSQTHSPAKRKRLAAAGGQLVQSAFGFLGEVLPDQPNTPEMQALVDHVKQGLAQSLVHDDQGNLQLTVTLSEPAALDNLAETLAKLAPTAGITPSN